MTDTDTPPVEPPTDDDLADDGRDEFVEDAVETATQFHQMMDQAKAWSQETTADLRVEAALEDDEETAAEIEQLARLVQTVTKRIDQGDTARARVIE